MRVLFVFSFPVRIGGGFKSALAMAKYLIRQDCRITIAAPGGTDEMIEAFRKVGAEFCSILSLGKRLPIPAWNGAMDLVHKIEQEDIQLVHALEYPSVPRAYWAALRTNRAFLATEPGGRFPYHVPPPGVNTVIFSAEQERLFNERFPDSAQNLHLIRARIDTEVYRPKTSGVQFMQSRALPQEGIKIGMAIRLEPQKRRWIQAVFTAASQLTNDSQRIVFVIAGEGALLDECRQQSDALNHQKTAVSIHFVGPVLGIRDICDFYNYADIVIGNGRGILEAMACKRPVIVLGENGQGQCVGPENIQKVAHYNFSGRHFRFDSTDAQPLETGLRTLLHDVQKQAEYAQFAYTYIQESMGARIGAVQLRQVYENALRTKLSRYSFFRWYSKAVIHKILAAPHIYKHRK